MPNNERSTDLILRAQVDQALQPLSQVTAKVKELVAALDQQRLAASNGIGSTKEYAQVLKELTDAAGQLLLKREALDNFSRRQAAVDKQQGVVDQRQQKRDEFANSLPEAAVRTDKQTNALERLDRSLATSATRLNTLNAAFQKSAEQLTQMGVLTDQFDFKMQRLALDQAHAAISDAQRQAAQGIREGRAEQDPFSKLLQESTVRQREEKALADAEAAWAAKFIADQEREREAIEKTVEAIRAKNRAMREAAEEAARIRSRSEDVEAAFRDRLATEVDARVRAARGVPVPVPETMASARNAVNAVGIASRGADPITNTTAAVEQLDKAVGKGSLTLQTFNRIMDQSYAIGRQIASDASMIDNFTKQRAATDAARTAFVETKAEIVRLGEAVKNQTASLAELARAEQRLETNRANLQREVTQQAQLDQALRARRISTTNLTAETDKLTAAATRLAAVQARAQQGQGGFFGLSSYQLQNLSFQVNDVVTQLSLGQGIMRTMASQGGQIFQIFEGSIAGLKSWLLAAVPVIAALGLFALALERAFNATSSLRGFNALLAGTVDAAARSASALLGLQRTIERTGLSWEEAGKTVRTFLQQDLSTDRIEQFAKATADMAEAFKIKPEDAAKRLSIIPTGSIDDLEKFLGELHLLTPELVRYYEAQRQGGSIDDARAKTITIVAAAMKAARDAGVSPLRDSTIELTNAWHDLLDAMASPMLTQSIVDAARDTLRTLTEAVRLARQLNILAPLPSLIYNKLTDDSSTASPSLKKAQDEVKTLTSLLEKAVRTFNDFKAGPAANAPDNPILKRMEEQVDELTRKLDEAKGKLQSLTLAQGNPEGGPTTVPGASPNAQAGNAATIAASHTGETLQAVAPFLNQNIGPLVNAWCAAFANAALQAAGIQGSGSNVATSFEKWGTAVANAAEVRAGDILVQARGHATGEPGGHVGIATGQTKVGPGGGLLVEMVSGNMGGRVQTTFEQAAGLDIRRAGMQSTAPGATSPMTGAQAAVSTAAANEQERIRLQREIDEQLNREATGNSAARIARDKALADKERERLQKENDAARNGHEEDIANVALREKYMIDFEAKQKAVRDKEDALIKQRGEAMRRAQDDVIANSDPTNVEAKRRAVTNRFQAQIEALNAIVASGADTIGGMSIDAFRKQLIRLRDEALAIATVEADKAGVDAAVKERDDRTKAIVAQLHAGNISLAQAFQQTAEIVKTSGTRLKEAVEKSNADLRGQPQTPRVTERLAANAGIDLRDTKAFDALLAEDKAQLDAAVKERDERVKTIAADLDAGTITLRQAFERTADVVKASGPRIKTAVEQSNAALQTLPQTPQVRERLAANARVDTEDRPAFRTLADKGMTELNQQIDARNRGEAMYTKLAQDGRMSAAEADKAINKLYADTKTGIESTIASQRDMITQLHDTGKISDAVYNDMIAKLDQTASGVDNLTKHQQQMLDQFSGAIVNNAVKGIDTMAEAFGKLIAGTATWSQTVKTAGLAFAQFAAGVLRDIAMIIIKEELLALVKTALRAVGGGAPVAVQYHEGGIVGAGTMTRSGLNAAVWNGAVRAHTGGLLGLAPGEMPIIAKQGEEVLTADDPRHRNNMRGKPEVTSPNIKNVLVMDPADLSKALAGAHGEKVVLTHLRNNPSTVRSILGVRA